MAAADWTRMLIEHSVAEIVAGTEDRFIPQAIALDKRGGVHFRKGCYPGQEVVKRAQTYGQVKKRLALLRYTPNVTLGAAPYSRPDIASEPALKPGSELKLHTQICADVLSVSDGLCLIVADPLLSDGQHDIYCDALPSPIQAVIETARL
jgi:folate-binding protein YgfZ